MEASQLKNVLLKKAEKKFFVQQKQDENVSVILEYKKDGVQANNMEATVALAHHNKLTAAGAAAHNHNNGYMRHLTRRCRGILMERLALFLLIERLLLFTTEEASIQP